MSWNLTSQEEYVRRSGERWIYYTYRCSACRAYLVAASHVAYPPAPSLLPKCSKGCRP